MTVHLNGIDGLGQMGKTDTILFVPCRKRLLLDHLAASGIDT